MSNATQQQIQEDEIDLRELFGTLKRRKKLIYGMTAFITLLAVAYVLLKQPIYEVKSNVMVGFIGEDEKKQHSDIEDSEVIAKRLNIVFNVDDKVKTKDEFVSEVSAISVNKKLKNFITINTEAISSEEALKKNKEVIAYLQNLYQPKIDRYIVNTDNNIKTNELEIENLKNLETKNLQYKIDVLKNQKIVEINDKINFYQNVSMDILTKKVAFQTEKLQEYTEEVEKIYKNNKNNRDTTTLALSSIQMMNYQNLILNAQTKIEDLKGEMAILKNQTIPNLLREKENVQNDELRQLEYNLTVTLPNKIMKLNEQIEQLKYNKSENNVQNSKVIGEFVVEDYPMKPKKKLIVVVAFVTGLILSVFLAFFLEFMAGMRKEEEKV
jgi:capsular polysaccharide biosynthesis protein